jgi:hypothetical protein
VLPIQALREIGCTKRSKADVFTPYHERDNGYTALKIAGDVALWSKEKLA